MKPYPLAHVLTITTGRLLVPIEDVYDILNHATGDNLYTHVLPRAGRFLKAILLQQEPSINSPLDTVVRSMIHACGSEKSMQSLDRWLAADKGDKSEAIKMWLTELRMMFPQLPAEFEIPCYAEHWNSRNPIEELVEMMGDK